MFFFKKLSALEWKPALFLEALPPFLEEIVRLMGQSVPFMGENVRFMEASVPIMGARVPFMGARLPCMEAKCAIYGGGADACGGQLHSEAECGRTCSAAQCKYRAGQP
eukprot:2731107-Rhodomonas_salina.6